MLASVGKIFWWWELGPLFLVLSPVGWMASFVSHMVNVANWHHNRKHLDIDVVVHSTPTEAEWHESSFCLDWADQERKDASGACKTERDLSIECTLGKLFFLKHHHFYTSFLSGYNKCFRNSDTFWLNWLVLKFFLQCWLNSIHLEEVLGFSLCLASSHEAESCVQICVVKISVHDFAHILVQFREGR